MHSRVPSAFIKCLFAAVGAATLAGCSGSFAPSEVEPLRVPIGNIQGTVHGGQSPISGGKIYMYKANTTAYGSKAISLLSAANAGAVADSGGSYYVTTDANGNFSLSGSYCTSGDLVYMVAVGGNPGIGSVGPFTTTASTTAGSTNITVSNVQNVLVGMAASGTGVGGTVTAVSVSGSTATVTLSQAATFTSSNVSVTFSTTTASFLVGSNTITVASAANVSVGNAVVGSGVSGTVTAVSGTTVTLSQATTAIGLNVPVTFSSSPVNNTAITQMAALGVCPSSGTLAAQIPWLTINEVTTVAFAYSVSGFATTAYNVSTDSTGVTALTNAFNNAGKIVNLQWGQAPAVANGNPNSVNPQAKIYALANILATCVNTYTASSPACVNLFKLAEQGTQPAADEAQAIFNIAHNQTQNVTSLYNLLPSNPAFTGSAAFTYTSLTSAPTDWTLPVIYTSVVSVPVVGQSPPAYTSGPFNIAFDKSGNAWIGDRAKGVVEITPQGVATTYNNNFGEVKGVAVSPVDGSVWIADYGSNTIQVMTSPGTFSTPITNATLNASQGTNTTYLSGPVMISFAGSASGKSQALIANETTTSVLALDAAGHGFNDLETGNYPNVNSPGWIAVDSNGKGWIPSTNTAYVGTISVTERGHSGNFSYSSAQQASPLASSYSILADGNGNVWEAQITGGATLQKIGSTTGITGGGMNGPYKLALDGSNNIWIANGNANTVSAYSQTNSAWLASSGFSTSAQTGSGCVLAAPDPSGNIWAANSDGSVTELLGLATPTAAPFYGANVSTSGTVTNGNLGTEP